MVPRRIHKIRNLRPDVAIYPSAARVLHGSRVLILSILREIQHLVRSPVISTILMGIFLIFFQAADTKEKRKVWYILQLSYSNGTGVRDCHCIKYCSIIVCDLHGRIEGATHTFISRIVACVPYYQY